jgi:methionine-R-sulfoxide reductase
MTDRYPRFDPVKDPEWRARLTEIQYHVTREAGTERPNTGAYNLEDRVGIYHCICCGHLLFSSKQKYNSGCGWPAFHTEHPEASIRRLDDKSHGMLRVEVRCGSCDGHLGHVFEDGPSEFGGERYCINSASMDFVREVDDGYQDS